MQINLVQDTNALLDYSLSTAPAPMQVSQSATEPSHATLTFVISNSGGDVTVSQITLELPVGSPSEPEGADLTENAAGISYSTSDPAWKVGPGAVPGTFVLKPAGGTPIVVGDQGIAVVLSNIEVSTVVGTAVITVIEDASGGDDGEPEETRTCTLAGAKFPYGFSAGNFTVAAPLIEHGKTALLSWFGTSGPDTTYTMLWGTDSKDVTSVRQWESPPLTDTTTFLLEVQATGPDGPVRMLFSTTEIVANPDITAQSLTVLGATQLVGGATTGPPAGDLHVNGSVSATGSVSGASGALGSLSVAGAAQLNGAGVGASIAGNAHLGTARQDSAAQGNLVATNNIGVHGMDPWQGLPGGWGGGVHTWDVYAEGAIGAGKNGSVATCISANGNITANGDITAAGNIGLRGYGPTWGYPPGWTGGLHTLDVYAEGSIAAGHGGEIVAIMDALGNMTSKKKHFKIPHPLNPERSDLIHAVVEGPEYAVYYRGSGRLVDGEAVVELPVYFEALTRTEGRTVQVTPRLPRRGDTGPIASLAASDVEDGSFRVRAVTDDNPNQPFFWEVKAVRSDVEALETEVPRDTAAEDVAPTDNGRRPNRLASLA